MSREIRRNKHRLFLSLSFLFISFLSLSLSLSFSLASCLALLLFVSLFIFSFSSILSYLFSISVLTTSRSISSPVFISSYPPLALSIRPCLLLSRNPCHCRLTSRRIKWHRSDSGRVYVHFFAFDVCYWVIPSHSSLPLLPHSTLSFNIRLRFSYEFLTHSCAEFFKK